MTVYEGEPITLHGADGSSFEGVCRDYALKVETREPGETVFTALGEYAICQPDSDSNTDTWQLLPEEQWTEFQRSGAQGFPSRWATAEELRTRAGEGTFLPEHMDLIDTTLFHDKRKTSKENITLHLVDGALWLSTAQTMVNVYHTDERGQTYKLRETDVIYFDDQGKPATTKRSKLHSSLGETGHITGKQPERPFVTARRGLHEELGLEGDDFTRIVSTGSLLRLKEAGHHSFAPIKAEDRTHYFKADLEPHAVRPEYINREYDAEGNLTALIKLEWFIPPPRIH